MTSLFEILKASKTGLAPDLWTLLRGRKYAAQHSAQERELEGVPPLTFSANGDNLLLWSIYGNMQQTGTPTPDSPIYPSETGDRTENLINVQPFTIEGDSSSHNILLWSGTLPIGTYTISLNQNDNFTSALRNTIRLIIGGTTYYESATENYHLQSGQHKMTFTISDSSQNVEIRYWGNTLSNDSTFSNIMFNTGSEALPHEPYGFKLPVQCGGVTTNVYTAEPLRKIGDYTDYKSESAEYRVIGKAVLTGNETTSVYDIDKHIFRVTNVSAGINRLSGTTGFCSHLVRYTSTSELQDGGFSFGTTYLNVRIESINDKPAFDAYLAAQYAAGTPVCVWYVLATPTTESIEAPEIPTTAGSQTFDVDTTLKPSEVYIKYKG